MEHKFLKNWFDLNFESQLLGRYITLNQLQKILKDLENFAKIETIGVSENGVNIPMIKLGFGSKKILAWSQMHGNESTTTKGIFDFLKFLKNKKIYKNEIDLFLKLHTLYLIPILNPDGSKLYTRENFNKIDLNRDAQNLSQAESVILRSCYTKIKPDLCLNLHDQRSIFGFESGNAAAISFLAPSANKSRDMTPSRKEAVQYIAKAINLLKDEIPDNIGRFDDGFNINCVGDTFAENTTPTILIEAGHTEFDYKRDLSRYYVFLSLAGILLIPTNQISLAVGLELYETLPENRKNFNDILLTNVHLEDGTIGALGFQFVEVLRDNKVYFQLTLDSINSTTIKYGHRTYDLDGGSVLLNSQKKIHIGLKTNAIFDVMRKKSIYC